jgi:hypothetical protein
LDAEPDAFLFGAILNINLLVWVNSATVETVARIDRFNPMRVEAHPERISTIHIITARAEPPSQAVRDGFNDMHARWGHTVGCAAVVIERTGLVGLAVRSAVTGMAMLAPKHYRLKVFDSVAAMNPWFVQNHARSTGVSFEEAGLLATFQSARERALSSK